MRNDTHTHTVTVDDDNVTDVAKGMQERKKKKMAKKIANRP